MRPNAAVWERNPNMVGEKRSVPGRFGVGRLACVTVFIAAVASPATCWCQEAGVLRLPEIEAQPADPLPSPIDSDISAPLTLEGLEQRALASNPSVHRLAALVRAARANTLQVGLPPNPTVGYEGQQLGSGGLAEQHGVLFTQEIIRGGKLQLNRAVADRERMRLEQDLAAQEQRVLTDVRIAYYQVLLAQRQIEVADNLVRIGGEGSKSVDALYQAKEVGRVDILQAQLEIENAQILQRNAMNRHDSAWRTLAALLGDPNLPPQLLVGDPLAEVKDFSFDSARERMLRESPEISGAEMEVARARAAVQRARVEPVSDIDFEGLVNWQDNGIGGKPDGGVRVSLPMPVFNRNQGGIAKAEHELVAAEEAVSQLQLSLQSRLAPVFEQYANSKSQVEKYQKTILPAAEESLVLSRKMYSAGEADYTAMLTIQRTYSQTQLNYLDAVRALRVAEVQIDGLLLSGSLQSTTAEFDGSGIGVETGVPTNSPFPSLAR